MQDLCVDGVNVSIRYSNNIASIFPHEIQYMPTKRQMLLLYTGVPSRGCVMEWCPPYVRLSMRFWLITSERKVL